MEGYAVINESAYDALAGEYQRRMNNHLISDRRIINPFMGYLKSRFDAARVLELGPGSGLALKLFNEELFETTAIDLSEKIIEAARLAAPETTYIHSDFLVYDSGQSRFEGIFAKAFIHLFPKEDAIKVLKKMHSLLVSDGIAFVSTTRHAGASEGLINKSELPGNQIMFRRKWTESEFEDTINQCNYQILSKNIDEYEGKEWMRFLLRKSI